MLRDSFFKGTEKELGYAKRCYQDCFGEGDREIE